MRVKGAPWTRSSLGSLGTDPSTAVLGVSPYYAYPKRNQEYSSALGSQQQLQPPGYSRQVSTQEVGPVQPSSGSTLNSSIPGLSQIPEPDLKRAKQRELFDFYQASLKAKAQRGKDDVTQDPLKTRSAELSEQMERERAIARQSASTIVLGSQGQPVLGQDQILDNQSIPRPTQDLTETPVSNHLKAIENLRNRRQRVTPIVSQQSISTQSYQDNAALFFTGSVSSVSKPFDFSQNKESLGRGKGMDSVTDTKSYKDNAALFYGESEENPIPSNEKGRFLLEKQTRVSSEIATRSPVILGKTHPKTTISDPITGAVRRLGTIHDRFDPLGKSKELRVNKIGADPAPPNIYGNQPNFTKKSGLKPYAYNPLTGQDFSYSGTPSNQSVVLR